ncbi:1-phosphofructokinase [Halanaerobium hydrogeniformans]|uniref:Tagatose-6-phosphate kinase n=1 Tax=Halanaerobium hydrogeniformans TaxID=656519 RepID=E4RK51_HALHG|nr:1-phosphofructokinase [Halanaerobium hydrogeniformans]ADQ14603.1 1-phosphofructokinase [Halanaerobium hydrogeniformans]
MIKTLTLNPALDKTIIVEDFKIDSLNRIKKVFRDAGGKGINVSKMISNLGGITTASGFLGGDAGSFIKNELEKENIKHDFIEVEGETRTNLKMVDKIQNTFTDINEKGVYVSNNKLNEIKKELFSDLNKGDILVLSGSVPDGVEANIYQELIEIAHQKEVKTILDADGVLFENALKACPSLIKPNEHELALYYGRDFNNQEEMIEAAKEFFRYGVEKIMLSLGKEGAVFLTEEEVIKIEALELDVKSTFGAGDAMVAGLAIALENNLKINEMITLAAACSSASLINEGTEMGKKEDVNNLKNKIRYYYI